METDLKAQVLCVPRADGTRQVMLCLSSDACGFQFNLCINGPGAIALGGALNTAGTEADRVIFSPTGVMPS